MFLCYKSLEISQSCLKVYLLKFSRNCSIDLVAEKMLNPWLPAFTFEREVFCFFQIMNKFEGKLENFFDIVVKMKMKQCFVADVTRYDKIWQGMTRYDQHCCKYVTWPGMTATSFLLSHHQCTPKVDSSSLCSCFKFSKQNLAHLGNFFAHY